MSDEKPYKSAIMFQLSGSACLRSVFDLEAAFQLKAMMEDAGKIRPGDDSYVVDSKFLVTVWVFCPFDIGEGLDSAGCVRV